jgi:hypothetical protein
MDEFVHFACEDADGNSEGFIEAPYGVSALSLVRVIDELSNRLPHRSMLFDHVDPCVLEIDDEGKVCRTYEIGEMEFETLQDLIAYICVHPGMLSYKQFGVIAPGRGYNADTGEMRTVYICLYSDGPGSVESVVWDNDQRVLLMKPYKLERNQGTIGDAVLLLSNKLAFDLLPESVKTKDLTNTVEKNIEAGFAFITRRDNS